MNTIYHTGNTTRTEHAHDTHKEEPILLVQCPKAPDADLPVIQKNIMACQMYVLLQPAHALLVLIEYSSDEQNTSLSGPAAGSEHFCFK